MVEHVVVTVCPMEYWIEVWFNELFGGCGGFDMIEWHSSDLNASRKVVAGGKMIEQLW